MLWEVQWFDQVLLVKEGAELGFKQKSTHLKNSVSLPRPIAMVGAFSFGLTFK